MLRIHTLGGFRIWRGSEEIPASAWGRDKAVQLFQLFVTRRRSQLHKEQIIDLLWPDADYDAGDRDFKVALNAVQKALEPERAPRAPSRYILRRETSYLLTPGETWLDAEAFEGHIARAFGLLAGPPSRDASASAAAELRNALALFQGEYLPERRYEDWAAAERERLRTLGLTAMTRLAELTLDLGEPAETIRLAQQALALDPVWENACRVLMRGFLKAGNRPLALRAYEECREAIRQEFGLDPLPETRRLYEDIRGL